MQRMVLNRPDASRSGYHLLWLALGLVFSITALAKNSENQDRLKTGTRNATGVFSVTIASSRNTAFNRFFINQVQDELGPDYAITTLPPETNQSAQGDLVIALGAAALSRSTQGEAHPPVLSLLVSEDAFSASVAQNNTGRPARLNQSAFFSDPPLLRQALLGLQILPHANRVAILARPEMAHRYRSLAKQLQSYGLELRVFTVDSLDDLVATLIRALDFGDFLLGTPDPALYNRQTIKPILLTTYRQNRIVIGPEVAFVRAGVLASAYTPASALITPTVDFIRSFRATGQLPSPARVPHFEVQFNRQVAASLNIILPDPAAVVDALKAAESRNPKHEREGRSR